MTSRPLQMTFGAKTEPFRYFWKKNRKCTDGKGGPLGNAFSLFPEKADNAVRLPKPSPLLLHRLLRQDAAIGRHEAGRQMREHY